MIELPALTEDVARALVRLQLNEDFQTVFKYVDGHADHLRTANDTEMNTDLLRQRQGAIQALGSLRRNVGKAREVARRFEESRRKE